MNSLSLHKTYLIALLFLALIFFSNTSFSTEVIKDRPRLLLTKDLAVNISAGLNHYRKDDYQSILRYVDSRIVSTPPYELAEVGFQPSVMFPIYAAAYFSTNDKYLSYAKEAILSFARVSPNKDTDLQQRYRLMLLAVGFDWFHENFSDEHKKEIISAVKEYIKVLMPYLDNPVYIGGHSRFASTAILYGLISIWEYWDEVTREELMSQLVLQWEEGYMPLQNHIAIDGGYFMGWQYSAQLSLWPYFAWQATNNKVLNVLPDYIKQRSYWYLYGLRGDETFPRLGDINDVRLGESWNQIIAFSAANFKDPFAEWFYLEYLNNSWEPYKVWRFLFRNNNVEAISPEGKLPFDRLFSNSGVAIFRDAWNMDTTQVVFKSSSFNSVTHHHRDQNHFEVSRNGSLLIDSGVYDGYGSNHWLNYYSRSIAHNTLVLETVDTTFKVLHKNISNDGGQVFPDPPSPPKGEQPNNLEELFSEKYKLDGILEFGSGADCGFAIGEAARAYRREDLSKFERQLVFVRPEEMGYPPLIIIVDKVDKKINTEAKILFHANYKPIKNKDSWDINNLSGTILRLEVPRGLFNEITLVGGAGYEWFVEGKNYPPNSKELFNGYKHNRDAGAWRLELPIYNTEGVSRTVSVMRVFDSGMNRDIEKSVAVDYEWGTVVLSGRDLVIIPSESNYMSKFIELLDFDRRAVKRILIASNMYQHDDLIQIKLGANGADYDGPIYYCYG